MIVNIKKGISSWATREQNANLWALGIGVLCFIILCTLIPAQGLTDDDDFYAPAGISYFNWFQDLVTAPSHALEKKNIHKAFKLNKEHPPVAKWSIGFFEWLTHQKLAIMSSLDGARAGVSFFAALLAAFMFRLLFSCFGFAGALFAVFALFSLPRFLFHSQVATLDVPVSSMIFITTAAFFWSLKSRRWAWAVGIIFGLALGTKLNAPFMAMGFVLFWLLLKWRTFKFVQNKSLIQLPDMPNSFWTMFFLGPLVFYATWPYLWHDTFAQLSKYIAFHMNHYPILIFYQGTRFLEPYAPWHMPFVMAAGTIPFPLLCFGLLGVALALKSLWRSLRNAEINDHDSLSLLLLLQVCIAIGIVAFSHVPKYGGEKLFMPFFPLFCALSGVGFSWFLKQLSQQVPTRFKTLVGHQLGILLFVLFILGPGFLGSVQFHGGYALSYYSEVLGGLRGATAQGYERTYYDIADKTLAKWLDKNIAPGKSVHFEPNHKEYKRTYKWLKKDGVISNKLQLAKKWKNASYIVLTHERRWRQYPKLLNRVASLNKVYEKEIDGVPLYTVYEK